MGCDCYFGLTCYTCFDRKKKKKKNLHSRLIDWLLAIPKIRLVSHFVEQKGHKLIWACLGLWSHIIIYYAQTHEWQFNLSLEGSSVWTPSNDSNHSMHLKEAEFQGGMDRRRDWQSHAFPQLFYIIDYNWLFVTIIEREVIKRYVVEVKNYRKDITIFRVTSIVPHRLTLGHTVYCFLNSMLGTSMACAWISELWQ